MNKYPTVVHCRLTSEHLAILDHLIAAGQHGHSRSSVIRRLIYFPPSPSTEVRSPRRKKRRKAA